GRQPGELAGPDLVPDSLVNGQARGFFNAVYSLQARASQRIHPQPRELESPREFFRRKPHLRSSEELPLYSLVDELETATPVRLSGQQPELTGPNLIPDSLQNGRYTDYIDVVNTLQNRASRGLPPTAQEVERLRDMIRRNPNLHNSEEVNLFR